MPKQYVPGTVAPFIVGADGPDPMLFTALDTLIAEKRVPVMIGIAVGNGSGDAQGSQRGLEYDTMSGRYAEFIETDVLPQVEQRYNVRLTKDPDQRATMGCSSGASAALSMAWYRTDLYHRVLSYSGTYVNQQWPWNPETPGGAWGYHETLIPNSPRKPLRIWMHVGDRDLLNPNVMRDDMHDWVVANERMAHVLADKGYAVPVRVRAQRRPLRPGRQGADAAGRARVAVVRKVERAKQGKQGKTTRPKGEGAKGEKDEGREVAWRVLWCDSAMPAHGGICWSAPRRSRRDCCGSAVANGSEG